MTRAPFTQTAELLIVRSPRRVKDDINGRQRGRVRRRLLVRFYRRLSTRYAAWEARRALDELTREAQEMGIYAE